MLPALNVPLLPALLLPELNIPLLPTLLFQLHLPLLVAIRVTLLQIWILPTGAAGDIQPSGAVGDIRPSGAAIHNRPSPTVAAGEIHPRMRKLIFGQSAAGEIRSMGAMGIPYRDDRIVT